MRASILVLFTFAVSYVLADGYARSFERVWIWYAYEIDQFRPAGDRKIAPGCAQERGRVCNFKDLMEFIDGKTVGAYNSRQYSNNPNDRHPNVRIMADTINENGWGEGYMAHKRITNNMQSSYSSMLTDVAWNTGETLRNIPAARDNSLINDYKVALEEALSVRKTAMSDHIMDAMFEDQQRPPTAAAPAQMQGVTIKQRIDNYERYRFDRLDTLDAPENRNIPNLRQRVDSFLDDYFDNDVFREQHDLHEAVVKRYEKAQQVFKNQFC